MLVQRHRLLLLTTAVMALVALASVCLGVWHVNRVLGDAAGILPWLDQQWDIAERLFVGTALLVIIGGGSLLWRIVTPFVARLEASEARTAAIVSHAVDAILTVDSAGIVLSINPAGERLFGYEAAAIVGVHLKLLLPRLADMPGGFASLVEGDASPLRAERGRRRDGAAVDLELSMGPLTDHPPRQWIVVARDVTARRQAEECLRQQAEALQRANDDLQTKSFELAQINRELNDFTYIAAHDLKEPVRGIAAFCRMIAEDSAPRLDEEGRDRLATLERLAVRVGTLIDDLLRFARAGCCRPELGAVDLNDCLADVLPTILPVACGTGSPVRILGRLPVVLGDATLLGEVFRNLVTNAMKFNHSPRPLVEIGARSRDGQATIFVRDNGIGIAPVHHETVFEMFRRLHARGRYEGTGAGLAIVRKLVKAHGGRVWIESQEGQGTTVWLTLPLAQEQVALLPADEPALSPPHFALHQAPDAMAVRAAF